MAPSIAVSVAAAPAEAELLLVGVFDDGFSAEGGVKAPAVADAAVKAALDELIDEDFKGAAGSGACVRLGAKRHAALVGLGKASASGEEAAAAWAAAGVALAARATEAKAASASVVLPAGADVAAVTRAALAAAAKEQRFKKEQKELTLKEVTLCVEGADAASAAAAVDAGRAAANGVILARELVDAPPNSATPQALADVAVMLAERYDCLECKILEADECEKLGMGSYLSVAAAGAPPKFIHLTYTPPGGAKGDPVAVVGKGLTFDSGGYNLKAGAGSMIELMKFDMGGSAATLGAAAAVAGAAPEGPACHFIVAACENMVSWNGMRPGDVVTASNGTTIEVNNTDAEGRLTLCDALVYAQRQAGAKKIVDIATLTGACIIALGDDIAGVFTPSDAMAGELAAAGAAGGEPLWRMPMRAQYKKGLDSSVADMKNTGPRPGGSITAALFLKEFIEEGVEWAHVDIAGPVFDTKKGLATGFGVTTLANWVAAQGGK